MNKIDEKCKVLEHEDMGAGYRRILLDAPKISELASPGQFVHLKVPSLEDSALRRPFSIFDASEGKLELLYKTVGRGTLAMNKMAVGEEVMVLGPLGRGFPLESKAPAFLVGGGFGVAPLYFLAKRLKAPSIKLFAGGRTSADLLALERFSALGVEIFTATNDGSSGMQGLVTEPLDKVISSTKANGGEIELFACGPDPMLKAVAQRAVAQGVKGWISMDRHMVCGVGACYACIQKTVRGNSRCCIEGPVYPAEDLVF